MREIILKGIQKAQSRGLNPSQATDLVMDYLEISGEVKDTAIQYNGSPGSSWGSAELIWEKSETVDVNGGSTKGPQVLTPPAQVGKVLTAPADPNADFWTVDQLITKLNGVNWYFEALPDGWKEPLIWRGSMTPNPRGMNGVGVVFRCVEVTNPAELPVFLPLSEKVVDPVKICEQAKLQIEQLFSPKNVTNHTIAQTSAPGMESWNCGGSV